MKKLLLLIFILNSTFCILHSSAQVLCVYCYHQNAPISPSVNNFLLNGGFETSPCITGSFCPVSQYYSCDIPNWTCTGGGYSTYAQVIDSTGMAWYFSFLSMVPEAGHAVYMGNYYAQMCSASSGDLSCLVYDNCTISGIPAGYPISQSDCGDTNGVSIEQTVTGLIPGYVYVLEFWTGGEYDAGFANGIFAVDVGFGNIFLPDTETNIGGTGIRYIIQFAASSTSHTFKFTNWGHVGGGHTELVLDDVKLYRQPELSKNVHHCTITGTDMLSDEENSFSIYPNPAHSSFTVQWNEESGIGNVELGIYDVTGREVYSEKIVDRNLYIVNQNFAAGLYFVKVKADGKKSTQKLIIQ